MIFIKIMKTYTITVMALLGSVSAVDLKVANLVENIDKRPPTSDMLEIDLEKELDDDDMDLSDDEMFIGNTDDEGDSSDEDNDV